MSRYPTNRKRLSAVEEDALAVRAKKGDIAARNLLVDSIMPSVASQVAKVSKPGEDREDYVQEAAVRILESVPRFEPSKGHFITFALPWAAGARRSWRYKQNWQRAYSQTLSFAPIDAPVSPDGRSKTTMANYLPDAPDDSLERESTRLAVREAIRLADLTEQERRVVIIGLSLGFEPGFQTKCAEMMGLSRERVSQLWRVDKRQKSVLCKLRRSLAWLECEAA